MTFANITILGDTIDEIITDWRFFSTSSLSNHTYMYFSIDMKQIISKVYSRLIPDLGNTNTEIARSLRNQEDKGEFFRSFFLDCFVWCIY